jgi:hypothetical protein
MQENSKINPYTPNNNNQQDNQNSSIHYSKEPVTHPSASYGHGFTSQSDTTPVKNKELEHRKTPLPDMISLG